MRLQQQRPISGSGSGRRIGVGPRQPVVGQMGVEVDAGALEGRVQRAKRGGKNERKVIGLAAREGESVLLGNPSQREL